MACSPHASAARVTSPLAPAMAHSQVSRSTSASSGPAGVKGNACSLLRFRTLRCSCALFGLCRFTTRPPESRPPMPPCLATASLTVRPPARLGSSLPLHTLRRKIYGAKDRAHHHQRPRQQEQNTPMQTPRQYLLPFEVDLISPMNHEKGYMCTARSCSSSMRLIPAT
jgi:hypothetical protein